MKKIYFILLILFLVIFLGGCNLPKSLSHFSPKQKVNKDKQKIELQIEPSVKPAEKNSCVGDTCKVEEVEAIDVANPIRNGEPAIREFLGFIDSGKSESAISMMTDKIIPDQPTENAFLDQFDSLAGVTISAIEPYNTPSWTDEKELYIVVLDVETKAGDVVYGWLPGENTRRVEVVKDLQTNTWMINFITSIQ